MKTTHNQTTHELDYQNASLQEIIFHSETLLCSGSLSPCGVLCKMVYSSKKISKVCFVVEKLKDQNKFKEIHVDTTYHDPLKEFYRLALLWLRIYKRKTNEAKLFNQLCVHADDFENKAELALYLCTLPTQVRERFLT